MAQNDNPIVNDKCVYCTKGTVEPWFVFNLDIEIAGGHFKLPEAVRGMCGTCGRDNYALRPDMWILNRMHQMRELAAAVELANLGRQAAMTAVVEAAARITANFEIIYNEIDNHSYRLGKMVKQALANKPAGVDPAFEEAKEILSQRRLLTGSCSHPVCLWFERSGTDRGIYCGACGIKLAEAEDASPE